MSILFSFREHGQGTIEELRSRDFRKELEERERTEKDKGSNRRAIESRESSASSAKRQKLDQVPAASLDADDPLDDDSESDSDEDDTAALMAELQRIRKERAAEQAKEVKLVYSNHNYLYCLFIYLFIHYSPLCLKKMGKNVLNITGNGETPGGRENTHGEHSFWKPVAKLFFTERQNRHESTTTMGR